MPTIAISAWNLTDATVACCKQLALALNCSLNWLHFFEVESVFSKEGRDWGRPLFTKILKPISIIHSILFSTSKSSKIFLILLTFSVCTWNSKSCCMSHASKWLHFQFIFESLHWSWWPRPIFGFPLCNLFPVDVCICFVPNRWSCIVPSGLLMTRNK